MDFAAFDSQGDIVERLRTTKGFGDVKHFDTICFAQGHNYKTSRCKFNPTGHFGSVQALGLLKKPNSDHNTGPRWPL